MFGRFTNELMKRLQSCLGIDNNDFEIYYPDTDLTTMTSGDVDTLLPKVLEMAGTQAKSNLSTSPCDNSPQQQSHISAVPTASAIASQPKFCLPAAQKLSVHQTYVCAKPVSLSAHVYGSVACHETKFCAHHASSSRQVCASEPIQLHVQETTFIWAMNYQRCPLMIAFRRPMFMSAIIIKRNAVIKTLWSI